jgi:long-chain fatty acid transport protein
MKLIKKCFLTITVIAVLFMFSGKVYAGGLILAEQGQPGMGTAGAGGAALADDASTVYFNPAGMARLERTELLLGSELIFLNGEFNPNSSNTFRGSDGGQAGSIFPGGGLYLAYKVNPDIRAGLSVNAPVGIGFDYHDDWVGRYLIQNNFLAVVDIAPVAALKLTDWLSIGGGVDIFYSYLKEDLALFNPAVADGKIKLENFTDWAFGYNLGVLLEPTEKTRVGVTYRSQADLELDGDVNPYDLGILWTLAGVKRNHGNVFITLPRSITASLYQEIADKFAVLFDVSWQDWSTMDKTKITTHTGRNVDIPRNWKDTWRIAGGIHCRLYEPLLLKAGAAYDSSPTSTEDRLPDMPVDRQWRYAAGLEYDVNKNISISLNYVFIDMGKAAIDHLIGASSRLAGDYDMYVNIVGISCAWKFGK